MTSSPWDDAPATCCGRCAGAARAVDGSRRAEVPVDDTIITRERAAEVVGASTEDFAAHGCACGGARDRNGEWIGFALSIVGRERRRVCSTESGRATGPGARHRSSARGALLRLSQLGVTEVVAANRCAEHASVQVWSARNAVRAAGASEWAGYRVLPPPRELFTRLAHDEFRIRNALKRPPRAARSRC